MAVFGLCTASWSAHLLARVPGAVPSLLRPLGLSRAWIKTSLGGLATLARPVAHDRDGAAIPVGQKRVVVCSSSPYIS